MPTAPTANDTSPSSIESSTDNPTAKNCKNKSYNIENERPDDDDDCSPSQDMLPVLQQNTPRWKQEVPSPFLSFLLKGGRKEYQLDYNHNHRSTSVWDGTTHTDIVYDDDNDDTNDAYDYDKYGTVYDYAYGDSFNMNDPSVRSQFQKYSQIQDHDDAMKKYTQAMTQDPPQATPQ